MNNPQKCTAWKLELPQVSWHLGRIVSTLLNREISMTVKSEDDNDWSGAAVDNRFDIVEVMDLIKAVNGDDEMIYQSIPASLPLATVIGSVVGDVTNEGQFTGLWEEGLD